MRSYKIVLVFAMRMLCSHGELLEGYTLNELNGNAYKIETNALNWTDAKKHCEDQGATLGVPKSEADFNFMQQMVRRMRYSDVIGSKSRGKVWIGINCLDNYNVWRNCDGEDITETGFHKWAPDNELIEFNTLKEPRCASMDAPNPGMLHWWCHCQQAFFCQKTNGVEGLTLKAENIKTCPLAG